MDLIGIPLLLLIDLGTALSQDTRCNVKDFKVVENFDTQKFEGQWYAYWVSFDFKVEDLTHTYLNDGENSLDVFLRERIPNRECSYDIQKLEVPRTSSEDIAKMKQIIRGDYVSYAVVYGCDRVVEETGVCDLTGVSSSVWVRQITEPLPQDTWSLINRTLISLCTEPSAHHLVKHNKQGCRQCKPDQWTVQGAFDINQYMGVWYKFLWIPPTVHLQSSALTDYYHIYSREEDRVLVHQGGRSLPAKPTERGTCSKSKEGYLNFTDIPGKLKIIQPTGDVFNYWVIDVQYDVYSFVLGCVNLTSSGDCEEYVSWIWTRSPTIMISGRLVLHLTQLIDQYCIDPKLMKPTDHLADCSSNDGCRSTFGIKLVLMLCIFLINPF